MASAFSPYDGLEQISLGVLHPSWFISLSKYEVGHGSALIEPIRTEPLSV
jgi:hypothetical protein